MSVPIYLFMYSEGVLWASNSPTGPSASQESGTLLGVVKFNSDLSLQKVFTASGTVNSNLAVTGGVTKGVTTQKELT